MSYRSGVFRTRLLAVTAAAALAGALISGCGSSGPDGAGDAAGSPATDSAQQAGSPSGSAPTETASGQSASQGSEKPADGPADTSSEQPAGQASYPVTVTGDNGEVTIPAKPTAIASLSPTATEMLYAIGAGDAVVAVDKYSDYPTDLPDARVDAYQLNVESLTQFSPDLVVSSYVSPDQQAQFDALGIPVIGFQAPPDVDGMYAQIMTLGRATGQLPGAEALVTELKAEIADITADLPHADRPMSYYYELDQTLYSVTSDTFIGTLLSSLGMTSIADAAEGAAAAGGYPQLSAEFILDADPDYILLADTICCEQNAATLAARDGWSTLAAVADGRIIELDDNIASRWAPRITELLRTVVKAVKDHPIGR